MTPQETTEEEKKLQQIVADMKELPTLPDLYMRINEQLQKPDCSLATIATTIGQDVAVTSKIIKLVNSAAFGLRKEITSIRDAVTYIGVETTKAIIVAQESFDKFDSAAIQEFAINDIFSHSIKTAIISGRVLQAALNNEKMRDAAIMGGMLHDIGKLVFIMNRKEEYSAIYKDFKEKGTAIEKLEKEVFGLTHADVGSYVVKTWNLPESVYGAIQDHHKPIRAFRVFNASSAVYIANQFMQKTKTGKVPEAWLASHDTYLTTCAVKKYIPKWVEIAKKVKGAADAKKN